MKIVNVEKKLIDKLTEEFSEDINENNMIHNATSIDYGGVCNSSTIYIVLLAIDLLIIISISSTFFYFHRYLKKDNTNINTNNITNTNTETLICQTYQWEVSNTLILKIVHFTFLTT